MVLSNTPRVSPKVRETFLLENVLNYIGHSMNTKSMMKHLQKNGVIFSKCEEEGWESTLDGQQVEHNMQLGNLVWDTAKALGEEGEH